MQLIFADFPCSGFIPIILLSGVTAKTTDPWSTRPPIYITIESLEVSGDITSRGRVGYQWFNKAMPQISVIQNRMYNHFQQVVSICNLQDFKNSKWNVLMYLITHIAHQSVELNDLTCIATYVAYVHVHVLSTSYIHYHCITKTLL